LPNACRPGAPQGDGALPNVARCRRAHDGRASTQREIRSGLSRLRALGAPAVNFEFAAPTRILFGEGRLSEAAKLVSSMGSRVLVVQGQSGRAESLVSQLREQRIAVTTIRVVSEPTVSLAEQGVAQARAERCDVVVACGAGAVIDTGKTISALLANDAPVRDYLEVIGK